MAERWQHAPLADGDGTNPSATHAVAPPWPPVRTLPGVWSPRIDDLLSRPPAGLTDEACAGWLAEVEELMAADLSNLDRARLLEARTLLWGNGTTRSEAITAFHRDALHAAILFEGVGLRARAALNYAAAGIAAIRGGDIGEALELSVRALVEFGAVDDSHGERLDHARMANMLGVLCSQLLDYERAVTFYGLAAGIVDGLGDGRRWSASMHNLAETLLLRVGQLDPGADADERRKLLDQAEAACHELSGRGEPEAARTVEARRLLATVLCLRGHPEQAWPLLELATAAAGDPSHDSQAGALRLVRGRCLQDLGRVGEALIELDAALELVDDAWALAEVIDALQRRSQLRQRVGDLAGALDDERRLTEVLWAVNRRHIGGLMDQLRSRAGVEGERRDLEARALDLVRTAEQDPLTGLANRRAMERFLDQLDPHESISLIVLDIDHFKDVNDRYGHLAGDAVLCEVARVLAGSVRSVDRVARWGGEEFLLVLPGSTRSLGEDAAARVRSRIEAHDWRSVHDQLRLTISAGVAFGPALDVRPLLGRADVAMYAAKRAGRNRVVHG